MTHEADRLHKIIESGSVSGGPADKEVAKKLKKRELECQALWDTLKDMRASGKNVFDAN